MNPTTAIVVNAAIKRGRELWNASRYGIYCDTTDIECWILDHFLIVNKDCLVDVDIVVPNPEDVIPDDQIEDSVTESYDCGITVTQDSPVVCQTLTISKTT